MAYQPAPDTVLTVLQFTRMVGATLADAFPAVWVRGEVSNCKKVPAGHYYFNLKDGEAVLSCVLWRSQSLRVPFAPADGTAFEVFGGLEVYPPRGAYQLVVQALRPAGLGALLLAREELRRRLQSEGLFDAARKRPLPRFPRRVGVITSPVGAAVRDIVKVLRARWPAIRIVLAPVRVQGEGAAQDIAAAIRRFDRLGRVDVLIVGRGGGSLEDLWAFNDEAVVRAIAGARTPIVSAVGHEVDETLADSAADVRAATPSHAAELVVRDHREVAHRIDVLLERAGRAAGHAVDRRRRRLEALIAKYGFRRQRDALGLWRRRVDELLERAEARLRDALARARMRLEHARSSYGLREWPRAISVLRERVDAVGTQLDDAVVRGVHARRRRLIACGDRLRALAPRRVLERGYCLVRKADGTFVRVAGDLTVGQDLTIEFARGEADARIAAVRAGENDGKPEA
jgi:exodeoxyribonuclease VII large subunit